MKKIFIVLICVSLLFALSACSVSVDGKDAAPAVTATRKAGNNDSVLSSLVPAGAQNVSFATINGTPLTYQSKFGYNGENYVLRTKVSAAIENISGLTLTMPEADVLEGKPQCYLNENGQGALLWLDGGSLYSLSMESGATAGKLIDTYHAILFPDGAQ